MPKRDTIHQTVVRALESAGWTVTHDPFGLPWLDQILLVDLAAEQAQMAGFLAAEMEKKRIAVEIKSFLRDSAATDLEQAVGQYIVYNLVLRRTDPERTLFLAVSEQTFNTAFQTSIGQLVLTDLPLYLIVVNEDTFEVVQWIEPNITNES